MALTQGLIAPNDALGYRLDQQIVKFMAMRTPLAVSGLGNIGSTPGYAGVDVLSMLRPQVLQVGGQDVKVDYLIGTAAPFGSNPERSSPAAQIFQSLSLCSGERTGAAGLCL